MILPNIEERLETAINKLREWRVVKREFLPVEYTDEVGNKTILPTGYNGWKPFPAPYALYETESYYWFKAKFTIQREREGQKAYLCLDNHIYRYLDGGTIRPQGLLYLNGKATQGIDINHGDVLLDDGDYEMYLLFYTHTFERYLPMEFSIRYTDTRVEATYYDLEIPYGAMKLLDKKSNEYVRSAIVLEKALNLLDIRAPYSSDFYESLSAVSEFLRRFCALLSKLKL